MVKPLRYNKRNLRDLGGWKTPTGKIKIGWLFRAAQLDDLEPGEAVLLQRHGIANAVDLRHDIEKAAGEARAPARVADLSGFDLSLSDVISVETLPAIAAELARMKSTAEARAWMCEQYGATVARRRNEILKVLEFVMTRDRPVVFYCVSGKDRTGVIAALLLSVLGVSQRDVLRDYDLTNKRLWGLPFLRRKDRSAKAQYNLAGVRKSVIDALADAHSDYLEAALAAIENCGGLAAYLDGLDARLLSDFRKRLID